MKQEIMATYQGSAVRACPDPSGSVHVLRLLSLGDGKFAACDSCGRSETADMLGGRAPDFLPMFLDTARDEILCRDCLEADEAARHRLSAAEFDRLGRGVEAIRAACEPIEAASMALAVIRDVLADAKVPPARRSAWRCLVQALEFHRPNGAD